MTAPVLVIGATGNVGRQVVIQLAQAGIPVRAFTRRPPEQAADAGLPGVTYLVGDLAHPEGLEPALGGVEAVFLVWPFLTAEGAPAVLETIGRHVKRLVYLSSDGVRDGVAQQTDPINQFHADLEAQIRRAMPEWTILRSGGLAVNTLQWTEDIRAEQTVRDPFPRASRPLIHEADLAAVAVRALTEAGHAGATYHLTGPAALTVTAQAEAIGAAIGRRLRVDTVPVETARAEFINLGLPAEVADGILDAHASIEAQAEPVTRTVEEVTGAPARTFGQWAVDHADDFR